MKHDVKYKYKLIYPDGEEEISDDVFDSEEDAIEAAQYSCSCFRTGGEIMSLMGDRDEDIIEGDCDYEIIEIDD